MLTAIDEYDIRQAFDVLDAEKDEVITLADLETILLGLGFADRVDSLTLERQLSEVAIGASNNSSIDIETVLGIIRRYYPRQIDRETFMQQSFQLVDTDNKGYINACDVQKLASDVGQSFSERQAETVIAHTSTKNANKVDASEFYAMFTPPDPN
ncbi:hypothetical protein MPSEU_000794400 [Mayamaea pseudoterrestris]|nr:hypothetical protein MPSEU_000794400 [Mayamaea pseudoterrestris]